jgi:hypothetical protein
VQDLRELDKNRLNQKALSKSLVGVDLPAVKDYKNLNRKAPRGQRVKSPK